MPGRPLPRTSNQRGHDKVGRARVFFPCPDKGLFMVRQRWQKQGAVCRLPRRWNLPSWGDKETELRYNNPTESQPSAGDLDCERFH